MSIPQCVIDELHVALNKALSDFNALSCSIDEKKRFKLYHGDVHGRLFDRVWEYLAVWAQRIYNTLKARLPPPLYPIVKLEFDDDEGIMLFICYATRSDTAYITGLDDCIEE